MNIRTKPPRTANELGDAIELVLDLAFQNTVDKFDNPNEYRRQRAAIRLIEQTFSRTGEQRRD